MGGLWQQLAARRLWIAAAAAVLLAGAVVGLAHVPVVRARVLAQAAGWLETRGLTLTADRLDYNLLQLSATLERPQLAATGAATPFFEAERVHVNLPASALRGRIVFDEVALTRPLVRLRNEDGRWNLPRGSDQVPAGEPPVIDIRHLNIEGLRLDVDAPPVTVEASAIHLIWDATSDGHVGGPLRIDEGLTLQIGDEHTTVSSVDGVVGFDGRTLTLDPLTARLDEGQIWLKGRVGPLLRDPAFDMAVEASIDLARAAAWLPADTTLAGKLWMTGTLEGAVGAPVATLTFAAPRARYQRLEAVAVRGQVSLSADAATIAWLTATLARGRIEATGRVGFATDGPTASSIDASWDDVDVQSVLEQVAAHTTPRVASRASGKGSLSWRAFAPRDLNLSVTTSLARGDAVDALPLNGTIRVSAPSPQSWSIEHALDVGGAHVEGTVSAARAVDTFPAVRLAGPVSFRAADGHAVLTSLAASGVVLPTPIRDQLVGGIEGTGRVAGTAADPTVALDVSGQGVGLTGLVTPGDLDGHVTLGRRAIEVNGLGFRAGANTATGDVIVDFDRDELRGTLSLDVANVAAVSPAIEGRWHVDGSGRANVVLSGSPSEPIVSASMALPRLTAVGQTFLDTQVATRIGAREAIVETFTTRHPSSGALTGTARVSFDDGAAVVSLDGRDWALAPLVVGDSTTALAGSVTLRAAMEGLPERPKGSASLVASGLAVQDVKLGETRLDVAADGSAFQFTGSVPALSSTLNGSLAAREPFAFTAELSGRTLTLASAFDALAAQVARPEGLEGDMDVQARVAGTLQDLDAVQWSATLPRLAGSAQGLPFALREPLAIQGDADAWQVARSSLAFGRSVVGFGGRLGARTTLEGLSLTAEGDLADVATVLRTHPTFSDTTLSGPFSTTATVAGTLARPRLTGRVTVRDGQMRWRDLPPAANLTLLATVDGAAAAVSEFGAVWQGARLAATGGVPMALLAEWLPARFRDGLASSREGLSFTGTIANVGPATLEPFVSTEQLEQITGGLSGRFSVTAAALASESLVGQLELSEASVALVNVPLAQAEPTRLRLEANRVTVERWNWRGADNSLTVSGGVSLADRSVALQLRTLFDLRAARAFVPALDAGGFLTGAVDVGGTLDTPSVTGRAYVTDAMMLVRDPRVSVYDISATMTFSGTRLEIGDAYGWANGGLVSLTGSASYPSRDRVEANLRVTGNEIALEFPTGVRSLFAPDLRLAWANGEPSIAGTVTISGGTYRSALNLTTDLLSRTSQAAQAAGNDSVAARTRLDVRVVTTDDLIVNNNYARLEIGADLRVGGTVAAPALVGRLAFREGGEIYLGGNTYHLEQGAIDFSNPARIEPDLSITARTEVGSHNVTLTITGAPGAIRTDLSSDEGYTQDQLLALLLTGQPDSANLTADINGDEMLGLLSGELSGFLSRTFGVRGLRVERGLGSTGSAFDLIANDVDPTTRLTLSQEFSRYVEVILSQNLRRTGALTWLFILRPRAGFDVRFTSRDDSTRAVEVRHEIQFGGPGRQQRLAEQRGAQRPRLRVAAVSISGSPGFEEAELRRVLTLDVGDPFDFFAWQDDRDRLQQFYASRGYLEARVVATRKPLGDDPTQMVVDYQLARGPLCELDVTGVQLDRATRNALRARWTATGLDAFLTEDIATGLRASLSDQGYLRATVEATVERPSEDRKLVRVRVAPGEATPKTTVVFQGNRAVDTWELEQWMYQQGLYLAPWTDQRAFSSALEGWYRGRGHLTAAVRLDAPTFDAASTVVTAHIDEGPRFTVGRLELAGVAQRARADVLGELGLTEGSPYDPSAVESGRAAVVRGYRAQGFNEVRDAVTLASDVESARVDVTLTLDEGPRQVLREVVIDTRGTTNRALIARAIRLQPGQPVNLDAWQQSRRRLYELGTFRSVRIEPAQDPTTSDLESPRPVTARVTLDEWPLYRWLYGVQVSRELTLSTDERETRPALLTEFQRRNLWGRALTSGVAGRWQSGRRVGRAFLSSPRLFGLDLQSSVIVTRSREDQLEGDGPSIYFTDRTGVALEQRLKPTRVIDIAYSYRFERNDTRRRDGGPRDIDPLNVARYNATFLFDTRDSVADARTGLFHASNLEYASTRAGSDIAFVKYLLQQYLYPRVGPVTLAGAVRLGLGRALGRNEDLIGSERFRAGGGTSVRGYAQDSLGPRGFFGDPAGGRGLLVLNGEARFPIHRWLRGVAFVDAGNVFRAVSDISLGDLAVGTGVGLRFDTPAAMLRVDYGFPVTARFGERRGRWYFSVGQIF